MRLLPDERVIGIGMMSGTSADGIDAAAVELWEEEGRLRLRQTAFRSLAYPAEVRQALFRCFADEATTSEMCALNAVIGELFAQLAETVRAELPQGAPPVAFVASHGQTVWHQPPGEKRGSTLRGSTLQLGEAARIAERLRVPVVSDFRQQDLAAGGQGAPLVPFLDLLLFSSPDESRVIQNIGGIGNLTYLPVGATADQVIAFDTGPGNALMDAAAVLNSEGALEYDRGGLLAASAPVESALLAELLAHPYFAAAPPKSTGRELFGVELVRQLWEQDQRGAELVSTLTQLTVESIAQAYRDWLGPIDRVILCGGGARNPELVRRLAAELSPVPVETLEALGWDAGAKEAVAFAVMGYETLRGHSSNIPSATGASRPVVQGKICLP